MRKADRKLNRKKNVSTSYARVCFVTHNSVCVACIHNAHEVKKHAFLMSKLMLPGPSCHPKPAFSILGSFPLWPLISISISFNSMKFNQNPTEMASKSGRNGMCSGCTGPGAPRATKNGKFPSALATTRVPFGVPFYDNLARWLPKGGP